MSFLRKIMPRSRYPPTRPNHAAKTRTNRGERDDSRAVFCRSRSAEAGAATEAGSIGSARQVARLREAGAIQGSAFGIPGTKAVLRTTFATRRSLKIRAVLGRRCRDLRACDVNGTCPAPRSE